MRTFSLVCLCERVHFLLELLYGYCLSHIQTDGDNYDVKKQNSKKTTTIKLERLESTFRNEANSVALSDELGWKAATSCRPVVTGYPADEVAFFEPVIFGHFKCLPGEEEILFPFIFLQAIVYSNKANRVAFFCNYFPSDYFWWKYIWPCSCGIHAQTILEECSMPTIFQVLPPF